MRSSDTWSASKSRTYVESDTGINAVHSHLEKGHDLRGGPGRNGFFLHAPPAVIEGGFDQFIQITVQHSVHIADIDLGSVILDAL